MCERGNPSAMKSKGEKGGGDKAMPIRVNERDDEPKCQWPRRAKRARCERRRRECGMRRRFERDVMTCVKRMKHRKEAKRGRGNMQGRGGRCGSMTDGE